MDVSLDLHLIRKKLGLFGCNLEGKRVVLGQDAECMRIGECEGLSISFLNDFSGIKKLEIDRCGGIEWILRSDGRGSANTTLEEIELVSSDDLKGLVLMERGERTTVPTQPPGFSALRMLVIHKCNRMRKMGLPVGLPNLEYIHIESCGEIEEIFEQDEGRDSATLPKLKQLLLYNLPRLAEERKQGNDHLQLYYHNRDSTVPYIDEETASAFW